MSEQAEMKPAKIVLRELSAKATQDAWEAKARGERSAGAPQISRRRLRQLWVSP